MLVTEGGATKPTVVHEVSEDSTDQLSVVPRRPEESASRRPRPSPFKGHNLELGACVLSALKTSGSQRLSRMRPSARQRRKDRFINEVDQMRHHISDMRAMSRCILKPKDRRRQAWDLVVLAAMLYTALWVPFEIAASPFEKDAALSLLQNVVDRTFDTIFVVDIGAAAGGRGPPAPCDDTGPSARLGRRPPPHPGARPARLDARCGLGSPPRAGPHASRMLSPADGALTAWIALTDAPVESGCLVYGQTIFGSRAAIYLPTGQQR